MRICGSPADPGREPLSVHLYDGQVLPYRVAPWGLPGQGLGAAAPPPARVIRVGDVQSWLLLGRIDSVG
jgi:hypothetical protein